MKTILYTICLALLLFLFACQPKDVYYNIDPATKMKFKQNDTLVYTSALRSDTFIISYINDTYTTSDKLYHYENLDVGYGKLNYNLSEDSIFKPNFWYQTNRDQNSTGILWRNIESSTNYAGTYDTILHIGNNVVNNVFVLHDETNSTHYLNDVRIIYYCNLYGILQYDKYDGEVFVLNGNCFSKYIK